jgi:hypothetical protein
MRVYVYVYPKNKDKLNKIYYYFSGYNFEENCSDHIAFSRNHTDSTDNTNTFINWWRSEQLNPEDYKNSILNSKPN